MSTMKDYVKVIVTVVITFLATSFLNAVINKSAATQSDLIIVEKKAYNYTDKAIDNLEKLQKEQFNSIIDKIGSNKEYMKEGFERIEKRLQ